MAFAWHRNNFSRLNEMKFAILSAKQHSPMLQPVIIYQKEINGESEEAKKWMEWFQNNGAIICEANLEFLMMKELKKHEKELSQLNNTADPTMKYPIYYRLDVDDYMKTCIGERKNLDQRFVLYTDTDVAVVSEVNSCTIPKPQVVAMAAEHVPNKYKNGGVLVFNVQNYSEKKKDFAKHFEKSWKGWNDQSMLNEYFNKVSNEMVLLPNQFNYKYYWESLNLENKPVIIHCHGYKLGHSCGLCLSQTKSREEAGQQCPKCSHALWFYYENDGKLYKALFEYYKDLVYEDVPYLNLTDKQMHLQA